MGPLAIVVDNVIHAVLGYSPRDACPDTYHYHSESALADKAAERKRQRRFALAGRKRPVETGFFYISAWMLGEAALELERLENDAVVAVFFRDTDGTNTSDRTLWETKLDSIEAGFDRAGFDRGVAMLPMPKSEAWFICAAKDNPYQGCEQLEELPGNDRSPNSAKAMLAAVLGTEATADALIHWLAGNNFDGERLADAMPSFYQFYSRLLQVLTSLR
ncbi:hypothetical protein [Pseudomonas japonica]|uniref:hypothetical protein n=1 Tax=Pseudomonas japonica TaxID=256466 RepID=UPI0015E3D025|nr:hypothetical protein [Pseudomonas japonica]MBA1245191.1 hypothetical protein [Pseudomonas japonica]